MSKKENNISMSEKFSLTIILNRSQAGKKTV